MHAVRGAAWLLGGQASVVLAQLFYAAFTGRLVTSSAFGSYAVAASTTALVLLLANAGIGNAVARAAELSEPQSRALATVSLAFGIGAAGIVWLVAMPWSSLWGNPAAVEAIRWSALGVIPAPYLGLLMGLSRRLGNFRRLSLTSTGGGFLGMLIGGAFVWHFRSAASLITISVATTMVQTILLLILLGRKASPGYLRPDVLDHIYFGAKTTVTNGIGYLTGTIPQLALSRGVGAAMLGSWNRATVLTQVPLEMIQNSMLQVIYPEFRHDIGTTERSSRLWLDLLTLAAWVMFPLGAVVGVFAYFALPVILGPGWETAALLTPWMAMASVTNVPAVILSSALEATGRFRSVWAARTSTLIVMGLSATIALASHSVVPVIVGTLLGIILGHTIQLRYVHRFAIFPVRSLLLVYLRVALFAGGIGIASWFSLSAISTLTELVSKIILLGLVVLTAGTTFWFFRFQFPPIAIARKYGILKKMSHARD